uniref:Si:dkey-23i12.9 n=1 Tax=Fundulus heteroclitus TaxID=8078 RepID=A0A3Q2NXN7_FUNHE
MSSANTITQWNSCLNQLSTPPSLLRTSELLYFSLPTLEPPYIHRHHRVCTYSRIRHMTARLPGCLPNVSPLYHYPMALQCHCTFCSMEDTDGANSFRHSAPLDLCM